ncbi:DUF494 family protein [Halanaerobacter jeridensis]|uniref:Smg protein n=1 Tax=Halanaerobacter jeridensis TaxID=706427 RepID=A0A938XN38_9FIRM|nr:DUF494 family protein [Halanaerobacter jeridensis]MBM7555328.1 Smg protein [Halanaerobacter jeridensis]
MKENIFEIISQLVKRLLYEGEEIEDSEKLINSLKEDGYNIDEINQAFEFIFASEKETEGEEDKAELQKDSWDENQISQRVFNIKERVNFNIEVQGGLLQLGALDDLQEEELEEVITKLLMRYRSSAQVSDLWQTVEEVVDDDLKLLSISKKIPQFKGLNQVEIKHLH